MEGLSRGRDKGCRGHGWEAGGMGGGGGGRDTEAVGWGHGQEAGVDRVGGRGKAREEGSQVSGSWGFARGGAPRSWEQAWPLEN